MSAVGKLEDFFLAAFDGADPDRTGLRLDALSMEEAYAIQRRIADKRRARGERVVGYKVGCTSKGIRQQFGLSEPVCGRLFEPHFVHGDAALDYRRFHNCAVEPEFVLRMATDVNQRVPSPEDLIPQIESVAPGIEVHHYRFWFEPRSVQELICSNGIHACQVVGSPRVKASDFDWDLEGVGLFKNGQLAASGIGAEIMGGPLRSLQWLANLLIERGEPLRAGDWVIPGSPVPLVQVADGDIIEACFTHLGTCRVQFTSQA